MTVEKSKQLYHKINKLSGDQTDDHRYDDIIHLPHHTSRKHPQMEIADRAAQFAPFAALTGHGDAVKEKARLTDEKIELDDSCKAMLDGKLQMIQERLKEKLSVTITYFVADDRKSGGSYQSITGSVKKIDEYERMLILEQGQKIPMNDIVGIDGI